MTIKNQIPILVADDDMDDCQLIREALEESRLLNKLDFVHDGEELLAYLRNEGKFNNNSQYPTPGLILLDFNMPRKDGREALKEIKADPRLKKIPVVVLTTSQAEEDVFRTYELGANSFVTKPVTFTSLVKLMQEIGHYWLEIVKLPADKSTFQI